MEGLEIPVSSVESSCGSTMRSSELSLECTRTHMFRSPCSLTQTNLWHSFFRFSASRV